MNFFFLKNKWHPKKNGKGGGDLNNLGFFSGRKNKERNRIV